MQRKNMSGKELRDAINALPKSGRVFLCVQYEKRRWFQRWTRSAARQFAMSLSREQRRVGQRLHSNTVSVLCDADLSICMEPY